MLVGITTGELVGNEKVDAVITCNMDPRAFDVMQQLGIEVYRAIGKIKDAVQQFLDGKLEKIGSATGPMHMRK